MTLRYLTGQGKALLADQTSNGMEYQQLELNLSHPGTEKGEVAPHVSEQLDSSTVGGGVLAVLEMHGNRAGKVDFFQIAKKVLKSTIPWPSAQNSGSHLLPCCFQAKSLSASI
jgi:hypothetical protein